MRLRLCMVVHAYYPLAEPRVERQARAARNAGHDVTVIALRASGDRGRDIVDGVEVRRLPVRHVRGARLPRLALEYLAFTMLALLEIIRVQVCGRIDTVQVHAPPDFLVIAGLPAKLRGARLLLDVHDLSPHIFGARFRNGIVRRALERVERWACGIADAVVTVHDPYRDELVARGVPAQKVHRVMNAVDPAVLRAAAARRETETSDGFTLAYHGTVNRWYGVDLVVLAVARLQRELPDVRATIVGEGDAVSEVRALAEQLGVADRVAITGRYLPIEQALAEVAIAQCGVIPNRPSELNRFALSSKLFEYVELGIPVVVARLETLARHFGSDEVTFFNPGDADSLADAVRWIVEHPEETRTRVARARRRAREYAWEREAERYLRLLES
ncbi:MAG TPA: glycosyltransferase family 4 protein [Gaiellaceae bacterium]|nr:glycosyltransferase family 4 protein [Gaiellaceae bacterium]